MEGYKACFFLGPPVLVASGAFLLSANSLKINSKQFIFNFPEK